MRFVSKFIVSMKKKQHFFTLMELTVVIGIIALLCGVSIPMMSRNPQTSFNSNKQSIVNLLESARSMAMLTGRPVSVVVDAELGILSIFLSEDESWINTSSENSDEEIANDVDLSVKVKKSLAREVSTVVLIEPMRIETEESPCSFYFRPDGCSNLRSIRLVQGELNATLSVLPLTGLIQVSEEKQ